MNDIHSFYNPKTSKVLLLLQQLRLRSGLAPDKLRICQSLQADRLLAYARQYSPFWQQQKTNTESFSGLGVLSRGMLQEHFINMRVHGSPLKASDIFLVATSGTTGKPVRVEKSTQFQSPLEAAYALLDIAWHRRDMSSKIAEIGFFTEEKSLQSWGSLYSELGYRGLYEKRAIANRKPQDHLDWLKVVRPKYLMASPFLVEQMSRIAIDEGIDLAIEQVISKSERVTPTQRRLAFKAFGAKIVDRYSSEENGMIALQCPKHDHLHVLPGSLVEIVDESGKTCPVGKPGRVLVTSLYSYAMPLIRYDIGDMAEWGEACDCGITWPVIKKLWGRVRNRVVLPDGSGFPMGFLGDDLGKIPAIREFRVRQYHCKGLELQLRLDAPLLQADFALIAQTLKKSGLAGLVLVIRVVDQIDWVPGKKRDEFEQINSEMPDFPADCVARMKI